MRNSALALALALTWGLLALFALFAATKRPREGNENEDTFHAQARSRVDDFVLMSVDPTGERDDEELPTPESRVHADR